MIIINDNGVSKIQSGTVTSASIVDGTIAPADLTGAQTGSAPLYGCRAWCVFDGTLTGTNAPTAGGNVTNVTRNGTGDYTINLTTAMPDANYCATLTGRPPAGNAGSQWIVSVYQPTGGIYTTTQLRILAGNSVNASPLDFPLISVAIFR